MTLPTHPGDRDTFRRSVQAIQQHHHCPCDRPGGVMAAVPPDDGLLCDRGSDLLPPAEAHPGAL